MSTIPADITNSFPVPDPYQFDLAQIEGAMAELTERQRAILAWIANGRTNAEIAIIMDLGRNTVEREISTILRVFEVENRFGAGAAYLFWQFSGNPK